MSETSPSQILVVNAGGQYCHLIARRVRELGVQAEICSPKDAADQIDQSRGIILSGGPSSVYLSDAPKFPLSLFDGTVPILGICYGHQVLAQTLGGAVRAGQTHEYGKAVIEIIGHDTILRGVPDRQTVWMSHGDEVVTVPPGFRVLARSESCGIAVMADLTKKFFGLQFHPEVTETPCGNNIIENFVFKICHCKKDWKVENLLERLKSQIRLQVGSRHVLFFVSGGVDSTVAFTLCSDALGPNRVTGVFVDTGFMRKGERQEIESTFAKRGWNNIRFEDAEQLFLDAVVEIADPEEKRKRIGETFLKVQRKVETDLCLATGAWMLGQGTIYPDTIESGFSDKSAVIKTHHNRVAAIEKMIEDGLILEPLRDFYKDEVRSIGREIGLPETIVAKNPFPGPGLAVRCLCSTEEFHAQTPNAVRDVARGFGLNAWGIPIRTVGVQGDHRSYSNLVILTGEADLPVYSEASRKITREVRGTNRITFLVSLASSEAVGNAKVQRKFITKDRLELLREADAISHKMLENEGLASDVWQFPVVLLPLALDHGETIALRPVSSSDAMTARHANLPLTFIQRLGRKLMKLHGVDMVLYDVTDKPPATIEWE